MADKETFGSLFGKAKKWAQQELKNSTTFGGTPGEHRAAEAANDDLARQIEYEAEELQQRAIVDALTPQSLKDYQARSAADKAEREKTKQAEARADRQSRAGDSRVELSGCFSGVAEGLAVETNQYDEDTTVYVQVECVDPVQMVGCTLSGFCFAIPDFHGDGAYPLVSDDIDATQYELYITDENQEGWGFHPSFGPGVIVVANGVAEVDLTMGSARNDTARLRATITL